MTDLDFMQLAIKEAKKAAARGEVPVGAVVVKEGVVLAKAGNFKELRQDPTGHAEILAIQAACASLGSWRLEGCQLYVTLEPCLMCSGAILQSRMEEVIFASRDPKGGAIVSCCESFETPGINHRPRWKEGLLQEESSQILKDFFKSLRGPK